MKTKRMIKGASEVKMDKLIAALQDECAMLRRDLARAQEQHCMDVALLTGRDKIIDAYTEEVLELKEKIIGLENELRGDA